MEQPPKCSSPVALSKRMEEISCSQYVAAFLIGIGPKHRWLSREVFRLVFHTRFTRASSRLHTATGVLYCWIRVVRQCLPLSSHHRILLSRIVRRQKGLGDNALSMKPRRSQRRDRSSTGAQKVWHFRSDPTACFGLRLPMRNLSWCGLRSSPVDQPSAAVTLLSPAWQSATVTRIFVRRPYSRLRAAQQIALLMR